MARKARSLTEDAAPQTALPLVAEKPKKTRGRKKAEPEPRAPEKPRAAAISAAAAFKAVVFTDLHVCAKSLDRALSLLHRVGALAKEHDAIIVSLGDFWDQRASLSVRQLNAVLDVLRTWQDQGTQVVMIPGNHDQVSLDGSIHAVRAFEPFPNIVVATAPLIDPSAKLAFLPWREVPSEQSSLFEALDGSGWTIFAHAEVRGATSNGGHTAPGRVTVETIEQRARACYVGHYHRRQQLGDRTWYIGSPFEQGFGEMGDPKGVAIVTSDHIEPVFLDIDDFPKHHRIHWPEEKGALSAVREHDIVELYMAREDLHGPELSNALAHVKAADIRPLPEPRKEEAGGAPTIALTVDAAIGEWCKVIDKDDATKARIEALARAILSTVADKKHIVPLAPRARIEKIIVDDFCAVRGHAEMAFAEEHRGFGPMLFRGRMGVGKTSLCDAITWAFHGVTTPRRVGPQGGGLRADDVIHDDAQECRVRVCVDIGPAPNGDPLWPVAVERTKKRGKGAELRLYGAHLPSEGISDTQEIVNRIIGLDYDLWRATVYLGQGAVANFITDGDKKRKELLARAFGLGTIEPALAAVRTRLKAAVTHRASLQGGVERVTAALDAVRGTDFSAQAHAWEEQRRARIEALTQIMMEEATRVQTEIDPHLTAEPQWLDVKVRYEAHRDGLVKALSSHSPNDEQRAKLAAEMGAAQAERARAEKRLEDARRHYAQLADPNAGATCRACGQALDEERRSIQTVEVEQEIEALQAEIEQYAVRASNAYQAIRALDASGGNPYREQIEAQMREANEMLDKCASALNALVKLKANREAALRRYNEAQAEQTKLASDVNPFAAKAAETAAKIAEYEAQLSQAQEHLAEAAQNVLDLEEVETMFSPKGLPVLVLRTVIYELETQANRFLGMLLNGAVHCAVSLAEDDLEILWFEYDPVKRAHVERSFFQLSGGQRRCAELAFSPFALSEMIFARAGVRVSFLVVDELTTHLDRDTKPLVCNLLRSLDRDATVIIDHDDGVAGEFDLVYDVMRNADGTLSVQRAVK